MEFTDSYEIPAPRQAVWGALLDPAVLQEALPGCKSLTREAETDSFIGEVQLKLGPVKANFKGVVEIKDMDPGRGYRLVGSGKGGAAGFASGEATVTLVELDAAMTRLDYKATARIGGKIAQLGDRLVAAAGKKIADNFFERLAEIMTEQNKKTEPPAPAADGTQTGAEPSPVQTPAQTPVQTPVQTTATAAGEALR